VFTRVCRATGGECKKTRYLGSGITALGSVHVSQPGDWMLSLWRQDAAGNASESLASVPVHLRYDPEPPRLAFERQALGDPTRISVRVTERYSGLAGGSIELRRQGTTTWNALSTRIEGGHMVARMDDSRLSAGVYQFRAFGRDRAGNESSTTSRVDGTPMLLRLPMRFATTLAAGFVRVKSVRKRVRRHGRRVLVRRRVKKLVPTAALRFGRRIRLSGRLTNADGQPIGGATVYVYSRSVVDPEHLVGALTTDSTGRFSYVTRASRSRVLRLLYAGTPLALPAQREARLRVPAGSTIRANRRRARNGQSVAFRGRVRTRPLPTTGKLVEIQAHFRGRWRTFSTVHSSSNGRWGFRYRFGGTTGRVRYKFRALLPAEAGYPFEKGRSRAVAVTVRGP
jgi:hypothetical protein